MACTHTRPAQRLTTGHDALKQLPRELAALGVTRALVLCGHSAATGTVLADVQKAAGDTVVNIFTGCRTNAPLPMVEHLAQHVRDEQIDGLISVGGGSVHDAAKGATVLVGEGGRLADHASRFVPPDRLVVPELAGSRLPIIAIPTTLSASEATVSAGFHDQQARTKLVVVDRAAPVRSVILDPQLASTTPTSVLAASAGNALNHAVEAIYSRGHAPFTDALATSALRMLSESIASALGGDRDAMEACQVGAYLSGLAMPATGLGVNHALCHTLGVFGASHGAANSAMITHGMRFNLPASADRQAIIAQAIGYGNDGADAADGIETILRAVGAPTRLADVGLDRAALPAVAERALHDRHMFANPRAVTDTVELERLLQEAW
jgi:alcohol dehydrogenase